MVFKSTQAPAQKKRQQTRTQGQADFDNFVTVQFPAAAAATTAPCPWGQDDEAMDFADIVSPASSTQDRRAASERMGEEAAIVVLQDTLAQNNIEYDDTNLRVFSGANTFNMVYFHPDATNPSAAIVLEAKGGSSQCGSRTDPVTGAVVRQGTSAYLQVEAAVMASSTDPDKQAAGQKLQQLLAQNNGSVLYTGVRAPYNRQKGVAYDPEIIFSLRV